MDIGKNIKALRFAKGITQEALGEYLGVSFQAVSKWETDTSAPDIALLPKIAVFFGITVDELFRIPNGEEFERIENMFWQEGAISPETFSHCIRFLERVLQDEPQNARACTCMAQLYNFRAESDRKTADKYARKALEINPDAKAAHIALLDANKGVCGDGWLENHFELIEYFKKFLETNPDNFLALRFIVENLLDDCRYDEAALYIERMRAVKSDHLYYFYMGDVMFGKGKRPEGLEYWNIAMDKYPEAWQAYCCRADRLIKLGKYDEALRDYEKCFVIQDPPRLTDGLHSMAQIHELLGDYAAAISDRERIIKCLCDEYNVTFGEGIDKQNREIARLKALL